MNIDVIKTAGGVGITPVSLVVGAVVEALLKSRAKSATKYLKPNLVVRATRRLYGGRIQYEGKVTEVSVTIGKPNYLEREFIQSRRKAKLSFPVVNIQLRFPPKPKARRAA